MSTEKLFKIGFVQKSHGLKGDLKVKLELGFAMNSNIDVLFAGIERKPIPYFVTSYKNVKPAEVIIHFEEVNTKEDADALKGQILYSNKSWQGNDTELDLKIFIIEDVNSKEQYKIADVLETPGQVLLEIIVNNKKTLIPYHQDLIVNVDADKNIIEMNIPNGLIS